MHEPLGRGLLAQLVNQVFEHPVWACVLKGVGSGPVLPYGVTEHGQDIVLQGRLSDQPGDIAGKQVATAALGQVRVALGVDEDLAGAAADERLVALQDHPGVSESF